MLNWLKRLFGNAEVSVSAPKVQKPEVSAHKPPPPSGGTFRVPNLPSDVETWSYSESIRSAGSDPYFQNMEALQAAMQTRQYAEAGRLAKEAFPLVARWLETERALPNGFPVPPSIPALYEGGIALAIENDTEGLAALRALLLSVPELRDRASLADEHEADRQLCRAIEAALSETPGLMQNQLKVHLGEPDGHRVGRMVGYLEKAGRLRRVRTGKTYRLSLPDQHDPALSPSAPPAVVPQSPRKGERAKSVRELDLSQVPVLRLPPSPPRWNDEQRAPLPTADGAFSLLDAPDWSLGEPKPLRGDARPDPAYRRFMSWKKGSFAVDDLGNAEHIVAPASAEVSDQDGTVTVRKPLRHGVYRLASHPLGYALVALSKTGFVHAYDEELNEVWETSVVDAPETKRAVRRLGISEKEIHTHLRTVALSLDASTFLYSVVGEVHCLGVDGPHKWSIRLPFQEGYTQQVNSVAVARSDVQAALDLMGLDLPLTFEDVKRRYRFLAMQWHPDQNPAPDATAQMQALNAAVETLAHAPDLDFSVDEAVTFVRTVSTSSIDLGGVSLSFAVQDVTDERGASDWVYASAFDTQGGAYVGGYSGHIVHLDASGSPLDVVDVGAAPEYIFALEHVLYLLTDTRLYILQGEVLRACIPLILGETPIATEQGIGLAGPKHFRWYRPDGRLAGTVLARDPLRRVYVLQSGFLLHTRTQQVRVATETAASTSTATSALS